MSDLDAATKEILILARKCSMEQSEEVNSVLTKYARSTEELEELFGIFQFSMEYSFVQGMLAGSSRTGDRMLEFARTLQDTIEDCCDDIQDEINKEEDE